MDALVIENGVVVDVIVVDDMGFSPGENRVLMAADAGGGIGWRLIGADLVPPESEIVVPERRAVSRFQALAALMLAGLLDDVMMWANDPATDPLHKLAFDTATEFSRSSPALTAGAAALGWSEEQLDGLFAAAAQIQA